MNPPARSLAFRRLVTGSLPSSVLIYPNRHRGVKLFLHLLSYSDMTCFDTGEKRVRLRWSWWILEVALYGCGIIVMGLG